MIYNLGTGVGQTVFDVLYAFEKAIGKKIPHKIAPRRPGDVTTLLACPDKAKQELGWSAELDIHRMCEDAWRWQTSNPNGYNSS